MNTARTNSVIKWWQ